MTIRDILDIFSFQYFFLFSPLFGEDFRISKGVETT